MRIALVTHQWPGARMGGVGSYVRQAARCMVEAGHEVHVFTLTLPEDVRRQVPSGVNLHEVEDPASAVVRGEIAVQSAPAISAGGEAVYRLGLAWRLSAAVRREHARQPFDAVEVPDVEGLGLPLVLDEAFEAPVVVHLHYCTAIAYLAHRTPMGQEEKLIAAMEFAGIALADGLRAPTRAAARETAGFMALPSEAAIIPYPYVCDDEPFQAPPDGGAMVYVGRIERRKGADCLAEALNAFLPRHPEAHFRFVGPDTSSAEGGRSMVQWIKDHLNPDLAGRVEFTGELSPVQVRQELRGCRFLVLPSVLENYPLACCEAMSVGRTAIVASQTGSVELMGDAGVMVERNNPHHLAEEMEKLWTDQTRLHDLSRRAYARIRTISNPKEVARQTAEFYRQVHERKGKQGVSADRLAKRLAAVPMEYLASLLPALSRMTATLCGVTVAADTPGMRLLRIMRRMQDQTGRAAQVLLYGAGKHSVRLMTERQVWEAHGHRVIGFIDDHPRFADNPMFLDLPVQSLRQVILAATTGVRVAPVVLSTDTYEDQFWAQTAPLRAAGGVVFGLYQSSTGFQPVP